MQALRDLYEAWGRGDFTPTDLFSPDMELAYSSDFPEPSVFRGAEGMRSGWREWLHAWLEVKVSAEELVEAPGGLVLVDVLVSGRGRGSGAPMAEPGANVWTFRDGRAVRVEIFADRAHARRVAGLA